MLCLVGSALIRASATNVYHIYIGCALWGVGVVFAGTLAAQIVSPLINSGETFGYRKAYLLAAVIAPCEGIIHIHREIPPFTRDEKRGILIQIPDIKLRAA